MKKVLKVIIIFLLLGSCFGLILKNIIKKNVYVEIGTSELVLNDFLYVWNSIDKASFVTNINDIDLNKVGTYEIEIVYNNKIKKTKLHLVDTTPPVVIFRDIDRYIDYEINPNDFILEVNDLSEFLVECSYPKINGFGEYYVRVDVIDAFGNSSSKDCILNITWLKSEYYLEYGNEIKKEDLVYNVSDIDKIPDEEINKINEYGVGEYKLNILFDNKEYNSNISINDTLAPLLELKSIEIYDDDALPSVNDFIDNLLDASSTSVEFKNNPENILGNQEITIIAKDEFDNIAEKTTTLSIKKDEIPPTIYGLHTITINKGDSIDYNSGVSAYDERDGYVSFEVDYSDVNTLNNGTYYATYTASDKKGNVTVLKRQIVVRHDYYDTNSQIKYHASRCGNSYEEIRKYVMNLIVYSANEWGGDDPVWQGLVYHRGNCKVYAETYNKLLEYKGYESKIIWTTDKTHYWNLVKINGVWRHSDSSPGTNHGWISAVTDEVRYNNLQGRDWDRTLWPEAK